MIVDSGDFRPCTEVVQSLRLDRINLMNALRRSPVAAWPYDDEQLRAMYAGGRGNRTARRFAWFWATVHALGLMPRRWVTLEVAGRTSHRVTRFPLGMADWQGHWYLVSMLGDCNWVKNVRAAKGEVVLRRRRPQAAHLVEVPVSQRAPILRRYLQKVPGGRPHVPVDRTAPLTEFALIAADYPVFEVETRSLLAAVELHGRVNAAEHVAVSRGGEEHSDVLYAGVQTAMFTNCTAT